MKILVVMHGSVPVAVYSDRRAVDADRIAKEIGGSVLGPLAMNRDIPSDGQTLFHVEFTKDGEVRTAVQHTLVWLLAADLWPGWEVYETRRRWRLNVYVWAKDQTGAIASARQVLTDVQAGRRASRGVL